MKPKIYKLTLLLITVLLAVHTAGFAQSVSVSVNKHAIVSVKTNFDDKDFQVKMDDLGQSLKSGLKDLGKNISATINNITSNINIDVNTTDNADVNTEPKIDLDLDGLLKNLDVHTDDNNNDDGDVNENGTSAIKVKNYTKSYPLDANDRIRLSNQFGKITVSTWDKHEIKVDVQIKAEAGNDDEAEKLVDGVQISDNKNGDQVSFSTDIESNDNGSWKIWNWGSKKTHKLTINYMVYMPAKTDLSIESSFGSVLLPDMDGKIRISISQGSVTAQNLSNPTNEIEGSYGSLKVGSMNGGKLDFSYGSVNVDECNNVKADLSYTSFKLGKLKGSGEFNLAYGGGFRIGEIANSLKKLNINSAYSNITVNPSSSFDFDVTTSNASFSYNNDKVNVTSKNPPDGSRHISSSRNYKGYVGKGGTDAHISINSSYGGVNFE